MMKIFITDAHYKHTLAAVRSMGKRGIYVIAGSPFKNSQAFYSKYCRKRVIYPDPSNEKDFVDFMLDYVKKNKISVLLPVGYDVNNVLSKYKKAFSRYVNIPIADYELMKISSDKFQTMKFANKVGVKTPVTVPVNAFSNAKRIIKKLKGKFPVVIKGREGAGNINYANSLREFSSLIEGKKNLIVQEYISGEGYGFFGLFNKGEARAIFMHKRIREYPITGGPSVAAESIYDPNLKSAGLRLLEELNWHGVAMVEFKKDDKDGEFKLMEINPKFWGSLELAISSGVDFPYLAAKMALYKDIDPVFDYKTGIRFRWLFPGDFLHLLSEPSSVKSFVADFFRKNVKYDIQLSDIRPNLFQLYITFLSIIFSVKNKNLKYPNGKPRI